MPKKAWMIFEVLAIHDGFCLEKNQNLFVRMI